MNFYQITFFFLLMSFSLQGQQYNFNEYARPEFRRIAMDFNPSILGDLSYNTNSTDTYTGAISFRAQGFWSEIRNSEKWQSEHRYSSGISFNNNNISDDSFNWSNGSFSNLNYFIEDEIYLKGQVETSFNIGNRIDQFDESRTSFRAHIVSDVGIGFGRLEFVGDLIHMYRLMSILDHDGILAKTLSQEEMFALTDTIAVLKNQRRFDFRLQRIKETEILIKFLKEKDYISELDFRAFAIINDAYEYENRQTYKFSTGTTHEITLGRDLNYNNNLSQPWLSADDLRLKYRFNDSKLLSGIAGFRRGGGVAFIFRSDDNNDIATEATDKYRLEPFINFDYFIVPSARVYFNLSNTISYTYAVESGISADPIISNLRFTNAVNLTYYFTPQLTMVADASLAYRNFNQNVENDQDIGFSWGAKLFYQVY